MPPKKLAADPPSKVGPPTGVRKSKRIKAATAKVQPGQDTCSWSGGGDSSMAAAPPKTRPLPCKFITLENGKWMNQPMALQQLHAGVITMEDIVDKDCGGQSIPPNIALGLCGEDTHQTDSKHDERVVEDAVQDTSEPNTPSHDTSNPSCATTCPSHEKIGVNGQGSTDQSRTKMTQMIALATMETLTMEVCCCKLEQCGEEILAGNHDLDNHPPTPSHHSTSTSSESDEGSHTMKVHRQMRGGGVPCFTNDSDQTMRMKAEAWKPTPKAVLIPSSQKALRNNTETTKDYHTRQMQHYEKHKDEETSHQLWVKIHEYWKESVTGAKDMSLKAMVGQVMTCRDAFTQAAQTWCNVKGKHVWGCVIYSGNEEAAHQAQGIFASSQSCMQLASEKQADVARLIDTLLPLSTLDSAAEVPLPNFPSTSCLSYDQNLVLWPQESRWDRSCHILPLIFLHKLYEVGIICGLKNIPWKMLLDLLYVHQYTLADWPAGVPAVGTGFNEQMGDDYLSEVLGDDDDEDASDDHLVPVPGSSFYLQDWSTEQLKVFRNTDPRMFNIPLMINMNKQPLHLLSDSQAFLKALPPDMDPPSPDNTPLSLSSPLPSSLPLLPSSPPPSCSPSPTRRHVDTQGVSHLPGMCQNSHIQSHWNEGSLSHHSLTSHGLPAHTQPHQQDRSHSCSLTLHNWHVHSQSHQHERSAMHSPKSSHHRSSAGNIRKNLMKKLLCTREEPTTVLWNMSIKIVHIRGGMDMTVMKMITMHMTALSNIKCAMWKSLIFTCFPSCYTQLSLMVVPMSATYTLLSVIWPLSLHYHLLLADGSFGTTTLATYTLISTSHYILQLCGNHKRLDVCGSTFAGYWRQVKGPLLHIWKEHDYELQPNWL
ncbi:hypothetical protein EDD16DRAFT_1524559 [Pisolithus croceorrhizus]|nr:hypothetical protein EDD16DRAFT_1524559 [Pisolithus croceorrhizus]